MVYVAEEEGELQVGRVSIRDTIYDCAPTWFAKRARMCRYDITSTNKRYFKMRDGHIRVAKRGVQVLLARVSLQ